MQSDSDGAACSLYLNVNGIPRRIRSDPETPLVFVLRNELGLKGAKLGCGLEQCGACAVLVEGQRTLSCNAPAGSFADKKIVTPECTSHPHLRRVKEAFASAGAAQCGYCIPGMVIAVTALFNDATAPSEDRIAEVLRQHLCRCGTQQRVLDAIKAMSDG